MLKKLFAVVVCVTLIFSVMAGCSNESSKDTSKQKSENKVTESKPLEITFWTTNKGLFESEIKDFQSANPNITVKASFMGANYDDMVKKVMAGIAANDVPNVAQLGQRHGIPQMYDSGKLVPIEDFMSEEEENNILPAFWERFTYKGKRVTVPFQNSMPVLYYNKDLLSKKGIAVPETFDAVVEAANKLKADTNGDGATDIFGFSFPADGPWYIQPLVWNLNTVIIDGSGNVLLNTPAMEKILSDIRRMVHVDKSMPSNQHKTAFEDFFNGNVAFYLSTCASRGDVEKNVNKKFEYGIAMFPKAESRNVPIGGNGLGIFKSSKDKEDASWKLVKHMISDKIIASYYNSKGYIPITRSLMATDEVKKSLEDPKTKIVMGQLQYLKGQPINPADSIIWNGIIDIVEKVEADKNLDIKAELTKLQAEVDKFLKDYSTK